MTAPMTPPPRPFKDYVTAIRIDASADRDQQAVYLLARGLHEHFRVLRNGLMAGEGVPESIDVQQTDQRWSRAEKDRLLALYGEEIVQVSSDGRIVEVDITRVLFDDLPPSVGEAFFQEAVDALGVSRSPQRDHLGGLRTDGDARALDELRPNDSLRQRLFHDSSGPHSAFISLFARFLDSQFEGSFGRAVVPPSGALSLADHPASRSAVESSLESR